jgi:endonuclease/exonuclease/phosphatase family metal-dependent hydrolase
VTLKILTLNIWNNSGPWGERCKRIREWIERLDPDVIGFQEVLRGAGCDQLAEILEGHAYHREYIKVVPFWNDASLDFGNAVASRWPLLDQVETRLPDAGDGEQRAALTVTIDAPFGPLSLTSLHLNWKLHHGWVRERQVVAACAAVLAQRPRGGFPPIMVGDFNAVPESTEIRYVAGLHALEGRSVHFRDAWALAGDGAYGATWSNANPYARVALEPDRRIDYIFAGPPAAGGLGMIESCRVVCNDGAHGVWPSDHFGVYAELRTTALPG